MRPTKIIATVGPASDTAALVAPGEAVVLVGVNPDLTRSDDNDMKLLRL